MNATRGAGMLLAVLLACVPAVCAAAAAGLMHGVALQEQNRPAEAEAAFREHLAQQPDDLFAMNQLGLALLRQGRFEAATVWLERAAAKDPRDTFSRIWLGAMHLRANRAARAAALFHEVLEIAPTHADAHYFLGVLAAGEGRAAAAAGHLQQAARSGAADPVLQCRLARAYVKLDMNQEAREAFELALQHDPDNGQALLGLGWLHYNQGRSQEAMALWKQARDVPQSQAQARESLALAANELALEACGRGETDQARRLWEQALEHDPGNRAARHYLQQSRSNAVAQAGVCTEQGGLLF